jgi:hypothetical protein
MPDLPTILGLIASKVTAGAGLTLISNGSTGQVELSLNQSFPHSQLNFNGAASTTLRNVTQNSVPTLVWGSDNLATQPWVTSGLATKQSVVTGLSYGAVNLAPNAPVNAIRANSGYLSIGGGATWPQLLFDLAPSSSTPHRIAGSAANFYFEIRTTQAAIDFWNTSGIALKINANSKNINAYGNLAVTGAITCVSVTQTSDRRVKTDIEDANLDDAQRVFDAVGVKRYRRTDGVEGSRVGFIAQDMQAALTGTGWDNVMGTMRQQTPATEPGGETIVGEELLTIDHSRLSALLWAQCKNLQARIEALEAPKKKTAKK